MANPTPNVTILRMRCMAAPEFVTRVQDNIWLVAQDVFGEAVETPNHAERRVLALAAIASLSTNAAKFGMALINNVNVRDTVYQDDYGVIHTSVLDADLYAAVSALWTSVALGTA